jgi:glutathione S-transferase
MLTVHHLNDSRSQRILWLLVELSFFHDQFAHRIRTQEELEIPYEIKKYDRAAQLRAPRELLNISPLGKFPIITDDAVTLPESGAIIGRQHCSLTVSE